MKTRRREFAGWIVIAFFTAVTGPTSRADQPPSARLEAQVKARPSSVKLREQLANAYAKENRPDKVIETLDPYTDQLGENGFLLLAISYSFKKDYANEVRVLKTFVSQHEENIKVRMLLAQAYLKQAYDRPNAENFDEILTSGIQELRRTLEVNRKYKPAYDLLLKTLLEQKNHNEARELLMEGINLYGERPELYRELCRLDSTDGFLVQAVHNCRESIRVSPNFPDHYVYLVQSLHDQGEDQQAERAIVSAAKRFPKSEFVQWAAGTLFMRKKNHPVAARYFEAAYKADPTKARAIFGYAQALFESGHEKDALKYFIKACKADATTVDTFFASGSRLKQRNNAKLGDEYVKEAGRCR